MLSENERSMLNEYSLAEKHCVQLRKQLYLMELFSTLSYAEKNSGEEINFVFHILPNTEFNKKTSKLRESEYHVNSDKTEVIDKNGNKKTGSYTQIIKQKLGSILENGLNRAPELNYLIKNPVLNMDNFERFFIFLRKAYNFPLEFHYQEQKQKESHLIKLFDLENPFYFTKKNLNTDSQQIIDEYLLAIHKNKVTLNIKALLSMIEAIPKSSVEFIFKYDNNEAEKTRMLTEISEYNKEDKSFKILANEKSHIEVFSTLGGIMSDLGLFDNEKSMAIMNAENIHLFENSLKTPRMSLIRNLLMDNADEQNIKVENAVLNTLINIKTQKNSSELTTKKISRI